MCMNEDRMELRRAERRAKQVARAMDDQDRMELLMNAGFSGCEAAKLVFRPEIFCRDDAGGVLQ